MSRPAPDQAPLFRVREWGWGEGALRTASTPLEATSLMCESHPTPLL